VTFEFDPERTSGLIGADDGKEKARRFRRAFLIVGLQAFTGNDV